MYRIVLYCSRTVEEEEEEEEGIQVEGEIGFVTVRFRRMAQRSTGEVFLEGAILDCVVCFIQLPCNWAQYKPRLAAQAYLWMSTEV